MTEEEKMLMGQLYRSDEKQLRDARLYAKELLFEYNHTRPSDIAGKEKILQQLLGQMGTNIWIEQPFFCDYGKNILLGDYFYANYNLVILDCAKVTIGRNVMIGPNVGIYTAGHPLDATLRNSGLEYAKPIMIQDSVWIGGGCLVLPGVTIGMGSVIGAGSVVNKAIPAGVLAAGNPCRVIREITIDERLNFSRKKE